MDKKMKKDIEIVGSYAEAGNFLRYRASNPDGSWADYQAHQYAMQSELKSKSMIKVLDVLSEGPIGGLVGGLKGIYFDNTPIQNADGSGNFSSIRADWRVGLWDGYNPVTPAQSYIIGFGDTAETPVNVSTEIDQTGIVRTIAAEADAVRILIRFPQGLMNTDNNKGRINGQQVILHADTRVGTSGVWTQVGTRNIRGKATDAYEESYRIERPLGTTGAWQVRLRRQTAASTNVKIVDRVDWVAYTVIQDIKVHYDGAAVVGIQFDADTTGGRIPVRSFLVDGRLIKVPHNYTPRTYNDDGTIASQASYSGTFNGSMVESSSACDNPAWILYDLLTNDRYGMGDIINASDIDIYNFYQAAVYNDELVDDGKGGQEPRFRYNNVIQTREDSFKTLQSIALSMRANLYAGNGLIRIIQDRPTPTSAIITNANVIDGKFNYSSKDMSARYTAATVVFNDSLDIYNSKTIVEEASSALIDRYGYNRVETNAPGCVHEGQARRFAKWTIDGAYRDGTSVSFNVSWNNALAEVGDVVSIADNFYANMQLGGEIVGGTANTIILDREVEITSGQTIRYMRWDGSEANRTVLNTPGTYSTLTLSGSENVDIFKGSSWGLYGTVVPRLFRIIELKEDDSEKGIYQVVAESYDPTSYARIESGIIVDPPDYAVVIEDTIPSPSNIRFVPEAIVTPSGDVQYNLSIKWDGVEDPKLAGYSVRLRYNYSEWNTINVLQTETTLHNVQPGIFEVFVYTRSAAGAVSPPISSYYQYVVGESASTVLGPPTGVQLSTGGTTFTGTAFQVVWNAPTITTSVNNISLLDYKVDIINPSNASIIKTIFTEDRVLDITREEIIAWAGSPIRSITFQVYARDTLRNLSVAGVATISNPAPAVPANIVVTGGSGVYRVTHNEPANIDSVGTKVHHSTVNGSFTPDNTNLVASGPGLTHSVIVDDSPDTYYVKVGVYDDWDDKNINYSTAYTVTTTDNNVVPPVAPTGLTVTSEVQNVAFVDSVYMNISFNRVAAAAGGYALEISELIGGTYAVISAPSIAQNDGAQIKYQLSAKPSTSYRVRVRAVNGGGASVWTANTTHTTVAAGTAMTAPTNINFIPGYLSMVMTWTNSTSNAAQGVEISRRLSNGTGATVIATVPIIKSVTTGFFLDDGLDLKAAYPYQYRFRTVSTSGTYSSYTSWLTAGSANNVPNGSITGTSIAANTIIGNNIMGGTITGNLIQAGAINANHIQANSIAAEHIQAGAITVGVSAPGVAEIDDGTVTEKFGQYDVDGYVRSISVDSSNRTLICGEFNNVGVLGQSSYARSKVCRFTASGNIDTTFNPPTFNGTVFAVIQRGSYVYCAGLFNDVNGYSKVGLCRLFNSNGALDTSYTMNLNGYGIRLEPGMDANNFFVCGSFTTVGGYTRHGVAQLNGTTAQSWPNVTLSAGATVMDCRYDGGIFTFVGEFTTVNGTSRGRGAKINTSNTLQTWNPNANAVINTCEVIGSTTYIGGSFTSPANRAVATNSNGAYIGSLGNIGAGSVQRIRKSPSNQHLFVTGRFISVNSMDYLARLYKYDLTTNSVDLNYRPNIAGDGMTVHVLTNTNILVGGEFTSAGGALSARSITAGHITSNAIQTNHLTAESVTIDKIASSIQSDNYVTGLSGWRIQKNGNVEFSNINARGSITSGFSPGMRVEILNDHPTYLIWAGTGASMTDATATFYIKRTGDSYFGGSLSAGVLRNAATSSIVGAGAVAETGPFGTNGNPKVVVCSLNYINIGFMTTDPGDAACTGNIRLRRSIGGGAFTTLPPIGVISGQRKSEWDGGEAKWHVGVHATATFTYTDNNNNTNNFNYQCIIEGPTGGWPFTIGSNPGNQRLTVVSTES